MVVHRREERVSVIKYLGSKRLLLDDIVGIARAVNDKATVIDLFSGTARVGHALKKAGFRVLSNDYTAYSKALACCYVQANSEDWSRDAQLLINELSAVEPSPGYFTKTFCEQARFFTPENGARIDAIREAIALRKLPEELEAIALVSLMEAADRVDSTTGVQMAYLKSWAPRAANPLSLRVPAILPQAAGGKGGAFMMDALDAAGSLSGDIAYLDPPYNQHSYLGNYHIWETLVRWDAPPAYGVAMKREDTRARPSVFNSRPGHAGAMKRVIDSIDARVLVCSFSNEGYLSREDLVNMLASRGEVVVYERAYKRYVGAQIGIFNPQGEKVGAVSHLRNTEFIFVAGPAEALSSLANRVPDSEAQISML